MQKTKEKLQVVEELKKQTGIYNAASVFFAIKDAIIAARSEVGCNSWFPLDNPATPERIRMACTDEITKSTKNQLLLIVKNLLKMNQYHIIRTHFSSILKILP